MLLLLDALLCVLLLLLLLSKVLLLLVLLELLLLTIASRGGRCCRLLLLLLVTDETRIGCWRVSVSRRPGLGRSRLGGINPRLVFERESRLERGGMGGGCGRSRTAAF